VWSHGPAANSLRSLARHGPARAPAAIASGLAALGRFGGPTLSTLWIPPSARYCKKTHQRWASGPEEISLGWGRGEMAGGEGWWQGGQRELGKEKRAHGGGRRRR